MQTHILIDGNHLFWRTYCSVPSTIPFNAEFGFIRSLLSLSRYYPDCQIRIVWDSRCTWRRDIYPDYKDFDTRDVGIDRNDLYRRRDLLVHVLAMILPGYESIGCEADDTIAALCYILPKEDKVVIYAADTDFHQLVDHRVSILRPRQGKELETLDVSAVCTQWSILHPSDLRWLRAYTGCNSDGIPGSRVSKKELAKIISGVHSDEPDPVLRMLEELSEIEEAAKSKLTPGWRNRVLGFHRRVIRNYRIMSLYPPRTDIQLNCYYKPDWEQFRQWTIQNDMLGIQTQLQTYFSRPIPKGEFTQQWIPCNWASYNQIKDYEDQVLGDLTDWREEDARRLETTKG